MTTKLKRKMTYDAKGTYFLCLVPDDNGALTCPLKLKGISNLHLINTNVYLDITHI